jgi:hypothetical protein
MSQGYLALHWQLSLAPICSAAAEGRSILVRGFSFYCFATTADR